MIIVTQTGKLCNAQAITNQFDVHRHLLHVVVLQQPRAACAKLNQAQCVRSLLSHFFSPQDNVNSTIQMESALFNSDLGHFHYVVLSKLYILFRLM